MATKKLKTPKKDSKLVSVTAESESGDSYGPFLFNGWPTSRQLVAWAMDHFKHEMGEDDATEEETRALDLEFKVPSSLEHVPDEAAERHLCIGNMKIELCVSDPRDWPSGA